MGQFKIVLAGCGAMAGVWVEYALERADMEIAALVDINPDNARALAGRYGLTLPVYSEAVQAICESGANVVFDVTVPASHFQVRSAGILNGCSVFGEKPMASTMAEAEELVRLSQRTGKSFAVMQNRRYDPNIRALRQLIAAGTIGRTGYIGADFFLGVNR